MTAGSSVPTIPKGVAFVAVASETGADLARLRAELGKRSLAMPLVEDRGAKLADQLAVEYSTHMTLLDKERHVLYSGGIDDERSRLTEHPKPWLRTALEEAVAGRAVHDRAHRTARLPALEALSAAVEGSADALREPPRRPRGGRSQR